MQVCTHVTLAGYKIPQDLHASVYSRVSCRLQHPTGPPCKCVLTCLLQVTAFHRTSMQVCTHVSLAGYKIPQDLHASVYSRVSCRLQSITGPPCKCVLTCLLQATVSHWTSMQVCTHVSLAGYRIAQDLHASVYSRFSCRLHYHTGPPCKCVLTCLLQITASHRTSMQVCTHMSLACSSIPQDLHASVYSRVNCSLQPLTGPPCKCVLTCLLHVKASQRTSMQVCTHVSLAC